MMWQINWRHWHLGFEKLFDQDNLVFENYLFIGPLQFNWFSIN